MRIIDSSSGRLVEIGEFPAQIDEPVAALSFTLNIEELVAVHANSGMLYRWHVKDEQLLDTHDIGPVGVRAVSFDANADKVVVGSGIHEHPFEPSELDRPATSSLVSDFTGWRLYDTHTGNLLVESDARHDELLSDVSLSRDGSWVAEVSVHSLKTVSDANTGEYVYHKPVSISYVDRPAAGFTAATFDVTGEWVYYADGYGDVFEDEWQTDGMLDRQYLFPVTGTLLEVTQNPTRSYLALATTDGFLLEWKGIYWARNRLNISWPSGKTTPAAGLSFSPDGEVVAVSTKHGWQIWSVKDGQLIHENEDGGYAVAFSPDGTMLAVGGVDGVVRIYAVE